MNTLKNKLDNYIAKHIYPQTIFARTIVAQIDKKKLCTIIDVPCGNGETSWHLSALKNAKVNAYDIDEDSIHNAQKNFVSPNLAYATQDILTALTLHTSINYICIINSLFLLPYPETIVKNAYNTLAKGGKLFILIPNTEGKNYLYFKQSGQDYINTLVLNYNEINNWFNTLALPISSVIPIAYAHHYNRTDTKFMSALSHFYLEAVNYIQTKFKIGKPNYFLITLDKK
ncbi:MAG: class I SAM-dependent methyltransferase [Bacteroidia bacterium]|nr:class I SAM-dependent methyltransferase [Bacteroidia bacterium]